MALYSVFIVNSEQGGKLVSKGKILIVDDQFGIRILLNEVFQQEGYQTFQASNGKKALEMAEMYSPDMVLLDVKIPGMDGIEILQKLKEEDPISNYHDCLWGTRYYS